MPDDLISRKDQVDLLFKFYQEHTTQARHHETQRSTTSTILVAIAAGVTGLIRYDKEIDRIDFWLSLLLAVIGFFGAAFVYKQYERYRLHTERAKRYRDAMDELLPDRNLILPEHVFQPSEKAKASLEPLGVKPVKALKQVADAEHTSKYPSASRYSLHAGWVLLHLCIAILGLLLAVMTYRGWKELFKKTSASGCEETTMAYALFVDMLGTSCEMLRLPDDYAFSNDPVSPHRWKRRGLRDALKWASEAAGDSLLLTAAFSDCGYIVTGSPLAILHAARSVMWHATHYAPLRGGIGFGNFAVDETVHQWGGTAARTQARFYGSAIVRAHRAESCGYKGIRVFVHNSAATPLRKAIDIDVFPEDIRPRDEEYVPAGPLPGTVVRIEASEFADVVHEICYIGDDSVEEWRRRVELLEREHDVDHVAVNQYAATREALSRFSELRAQNNKGWHA